MIQPQAGVAFSEQTEEMVELEIGCRGSKRSDSQTVSLEDAVVQRGKKAGALETFNRDVTKHFFFLLATHPKMILAFHSNTIP